MQESKIILDAYIGQSVLGVITVQDVLHRRAIFVDSCRNILGFKQYFPTLDYNGHFFYEVGEFAERVYRGDMEAMIMLNMNDDFVEERSSDFLLFTDHKDELNSLGIVDLVLNRSEAVLKDFYIKDMFQVLIEIGVCKSLLQQDKFVIGIDQKLATTLGNISGMKTPTDLVKKYLKEDIKLLKKLKKKSNLPQRPDEKLLNDIILKIRNYEQ